MGKPLSVEGITVYLMSMRAGSIQEGVAKIVASCIGLLASCEHGQHAQTVLGCLATAAASRL